MSNLKIINYTKLPNIIIIINGLVNSIPKRITILDREESDSINYIIPYLKQIGCPYQTLDIRFTWEEKLIAFKPEIVLCFSENLGFIELSNILKEKMDSLIVKVVKEKNLADENANLLTINIHNFPLQKDTYLLLNHIKQCTELLLELNNYPTVRVQ